MNQDGSDFNSVLEDVSDQVDDPESRDNNTQDIQLSNVAHPATNDVVIDTGEPDNLEDGDDSWLGTREETRSQFSDSSSEEEAISSMEQPSESALMEVTKNGPVLRSTAAILQAEADSIRSKWPWLEDALSQGPLLPIVAYQSDPYDTGDIYRQNVAFYRDGKINVKQGDKKPKTKGRASHLIESNECEDLDPKSVTYRYVIERDDGRASHLNEINDCEDLDPKSMTYRYVMERDEARKEHRAAARERDEMKVRAWDHYNGRARAEEYGKVVEQDLREADEERRMLKHEVDIQQQKLEQQEEDFQLQEERLELRKGTIEKYQEIIKQQKAEKEQWERAFEKQRPFAEAERERQKKREQGWEDIERYVLCPAILGSAHYNQMANKLHSAETQTEPMAVRSHATQTEQLHPTPYPPKLIDAQTQTDPEMTDSIERTSSSAGISNIIHSPKADESKFEPTRYMALAFKRPRQHDEERALTDWQAILVILAMTAVISAFHLHRTSFLHHTGISSVTMGIIIISVAALPLLFVNTLAAPAMPLDSTVNDGSDQERLEGKLEEKDADLNTVKSLTDEESARRSMDEQLAKSQNRCIDLEPLRVRVENENAELQRVVKQLTDERIASYSKPKVDNERTDLQERLGQLVLLEAQVNSLNVENWELRTKVSAAEATSQKQIKKNENSVAKVQGLENECARLQKLLEDVMIWTQGKTWIDEPNPDADNVSPAEASPVALVPSSDAERPKTPAISSLLTPTPFPSANGLRTPITSHVPYPPSHGSLEKKAHWIERERKMRNTEQWKRNREAVLRRLEKEERSFLRCPRVALVDAVG